MRIFVLFAMLLCVLAAPVRAAEDAPRMPAFTVQDLSHRDLKKGTVALNIFASWCAPCEAEMPALVKLSEKIPVYGIAYRDTPAKILPWLEAHGNPFTKTGYDSGGMDTRPLGLYGVPTTFILRKGKIIYRLDGPLGPDQEKEIYKILE